MSTTKSDHIVPVFYAVFVFLIFTFTGLWMFKKNAEQKDSQIHLFNNSDTVRRDNIRLIIDTVYDGEMHVHFPLKYNDTLVNGISDGLFLPPVRRKIKKPKVIHIHDTIYIPVPVFIEMQDTISDDDLRKHFHILKDSMHVIWQHT
jgi:hypothetical protein